MKVGWAIIVFLVALITTTVSNLVTEELRSRLDLMPYAVLRLAIRRLPAELQKDVGDEWLAELHHILHRTESLPVTRVVSAISYTLGLLRTARRIGRGLIGVRTSAVTILQKPASGLAARRQVTPVRGVSALAAISTQGRKLWLMTRYVMLVLTVVGGSTVGALVYLDSRFPNTAEQALLGEVPLALTMNNSCIRNTETEQDIANVQASLICTFNSNANRVVFTKFTSAKALDSHYQASVASTGIAQSSGNCLNTDRAESVYTGESGQTSGRTVCYQQRGSSFVSWTDDRTRTLAQATRVDPDYMKLRDWWAGVVGLPNSAETEAQAQAKKQIEDAQKSFGS